MRLKDLKETSSAGGTSAGGIASAPAAMGSMKKRGIYGVDEGSENVGTAAFDFLKYLRDNPSFVDFHSMNATMNGYEAIIELDDGHKYHLQLSTSK